MADWQAVIGLEVHAQLLTRSKLFCGCAVVDAGRPNQALCPVCMAHPGAMPQLNQEAVHLALRAGLALGMRIHARSRFDRKHYLYPDQPKGFQLTQQTWPLCTQGQLHVRRDGVLHPYTIERLHLEEDSGRLQHGGARTLVDWNRAGVGLIEVVGAPDLSSPQEAEAWLRMLHRVLVAAGVTGGALDRGQLRCDANLSLRAPNGQQSPRVELKNLNSFRFVRRGLQHEMARLQAAMEAGETLHPETRSWNGRESYALRDKEQAPEYRFQPEPDLGALVLSGRELGRAAHALPGPPPLDVHLLRQDDDNVARWMKTYGLTREQVQGITTDTELASLFSRSVQAGGERLAMLRWLQRDVPAWLKQAGLGLNETPLQPTHLLDLQELLDQGEITAAVAQRVLAWILRRGGDAKGLVAVQGLTRIRDAAVIRQRAEAALAQHPDKVQAYKDGQDKLLGFFIGQVQTACSGRIDPKDLDQAMAAALEAHP